MKKEIINCLLGDFNKVTGKYEIEDNIVEDLLLVIKRTERKFEDSYFCTSLSTFAGLGKLDFIVKVTTDGFIRTAKLYLLEAITTTAGLDKDTNVFYVAKFTDKADLGFEQKMFDAFQILDESKYKNDAEAVHDAYGEYILRRKYFLLAENKLTKDKLEIIESGLLVERLNVLWKMGKFGKNVLELYEVIQAQAKTKLKTDKLTARDLNQILMVSVDQVVNNNPTMLDDKKKFLESQQKALQEFKDAEIKVKAGANQKAKEVANAKVVNKSAAPPPPKKGVEVRKSDASDKPTSNKAKTEDKPAPKPLDKPKPIVFKKPEIKPLGEMEKKLEIKPLEPKKVDAKTALDKLKEDSTFGEIEQINTLDATLQRGANVL